MALISYDPAKVIVTFGGIDLTSGCPANGAIRIQPTRDLNRMVEGCDGEVCVVRALNVPANIFVPQIVGCDAYRAMQALLIADALTSSAKLPFAIVHRAGHETYAAGIAWLKNVPSRTFASDAGPLVEWQIGCASLFLAPI